MSRRRYPSDDEAQAPKQDLVSPAEHRDRWNELAEELGADWDGAGVRRELNAMWDAPGVDERVELVAARGGATLTEIGSVLGVSRERVRQIEGGALRKLARRDPGELRRLLDELNAEREETPARYSRSGGAMRQSDALPLELHEGPDWGTAKAIQEASTRDPVRPAIMNRAQRSRWGNYEVDRG